MELREQVARAICNMIDDYPDDDDWTYYLPAADAAIKVIEESKNGK